MKSRDTTIKLSTTPSTPVMQLHVIASLYCCNVYYILAMIKTRMEVTNIDKHANLPHYVVNYDMNYSCKKVLQK